MTARQVWLYFTRPYLILLALIVFGALPNILKRIKLGLAKKRFKCVCCGNCCHFGTIEISKSDVDRIEACGYRGFYESSGKTITLRKSGGACVFFEGGLCSVHSIKPWVCGTFPFFTYLRVPYVRAMSTCPGLKKLSSDLKGK